MTPNADRFKKINRECLFQGFNHYPTEIKECPICGPSMHCMGHIYEHCNKCGRNNYTEKGDFLPLEGRLIQ